ncbi:hypothetical protein CCP3SC1AL1_320010 [Gammaproteobacteria bacterium]
MENIMHNMALDRAYKMVEAIFSTPLEISPLPIEPLPEGFNFSGDKVKVIRLYECGNFVIVLGSFEPDSVYPFHTHGNSAEHMVCVKGRLEVTISQQDLSTGEPCDEIQILDATNCVTIAVGVRHMARALEKSEVVAICIPPEIAYCKVNNGEEIK